MASTASDLIKFEKMATGEKSGSWGTLANQAISRLEEKVAGYRAITLAGSTYVLDDTQYVENSGATAESHLAIIKATGTPGASRQITIPLRTQQWLMWNAVTTYDLTIAGASGDAVTISNGYMAHVFTDGANVEFSTPLTTSAGVVAPASMPAATLTAQGAIEIATGAETNTGSDATRAVSPDGLDEWTGSAQITTTGALASGTIATGFGAIDNGVSNQTTGGQMILDVDGSGKSAAGALTLGAGADAGVWFDGTDMKIDTSGSLNFADNTVKRLNLLDYGEVTNAIGGTGGGTQDIDLALGNSVTATVDTSANTFTFSNPTASDELCSFTLGLTNGGSQTVNWPGTVDWAGGSAPTLTTSGVDWLEFWTVDGGTIWNGALVGAAFA
jgi:hypothetical protein